MSTHLINFKGCSIVMGRELLFSNLIVEACKTNPIALICDDQVANLFGKKMLSFLQNANLEVHLFVFEAGEASKTRATKEKLEDQMQQEGLGRDTVALAIGGGVTTDLSGFLASTYCRGISFISVPTTLLGMVDASLGGKTGVNTPYGKNMIGTFYLPEALIMDYSVLKTLSKEQINEGLVEMTKAGIIYDHTLFKNLKEFVFKQASIDENFEPLIQRACEIKLEVVEKDFQEKEGLRRILNFGHTVGHAIEKVSNYQVSHGQAVAMGMIAESFISTELGVLSQKDFKEICELLMSFLPQNSYDIDSLKKAMALDKKSKNKAPHFVIIKEIGKVDLCEGEYCMPVDDKILTDALKFIFSIKKLK